LVHIPSMSAIPEWITALAAPGPLKYFTGHAKAARDQVLASQAQVRISEKQLEIFQEQIWVSQAQINISQAQIEGQSAIPVSR
jgi:hypothetical protein